MAQAYPQIIEHLIRDMNAKPFHDNNSLTAMASNAGSDATVERSLPTGLDGENGDCHQQS
jgi:hypothetical protein